MPDIFDDLKKIIKKDLVPILVSYAKDPNNKITDNLNEFLNDPQSLLTDILDRFSKNKNYDNNQGNYKGIENVIDTDPVINDEYDDLFKRLILIEETMTQIQKILKNKD